MKTTKKPETAQHDISPATAAKQAFAAASEAAAAASIAARKGHYELASLALHGALAALAAAAAAEEGDLASFIEAESFYHLAYDETEARLEELEAEERKARSIAN